MNTTTPLNLTTLKTLIADSGLVIGKPISKADFAAGARKLHAHPDHDRIELVVQATLTPLFNIGVYLPLDEKGWNEALVDNAVEHIKLAGADDLDTMEIVEVRLDDQPGAVYGEAGVKDSDRLIGRAREVFFDKFQWQGDERARVTLDLYAHNLEAGTSHEAVVYHVLADLVQHCRQKGIDLDQLLEDAKQEQY